MSEFSRLGISSDGRATRWRLTLPCGHKVEPRTTMLATQAVECPKCGKGFFVNYNKLTIEADD